MSEGTKHVILKLFGPLPDLSAFFRRAVEELYSKMLSDRRNAGGTVLLSLHWTLATIHFSLVALEKTKPCPCIYMGGVLIFVTPDKTGLLMQVTVGCRGCGGQEGGGCLLAKP